ncbi:MAG TPA: ATP-binding protein [Planctomycetota bacterium]|nr:ATP-binding protein [Planctomycetota bacterium]
MDGQSARPSIADASGVAPRKVAHVLVVEDEPSTREFLAAVLAREGYRVTSAGDVETALAFAREDPPNVLLTDLKLGQADGRTLVRRVRDANPSTVPIVITGFGTVDGVVDLVRSGVFDVLAKPCPAAEVAARVAKAVEHQAMLEANADLRERLRVQEKLAMIGKLAAGVAHELNNPLDATLRCVRLAWDRTASDPESREYLDLARAGLQRMADIVKSLLTFSRQAAIEQAPAPLASLVEEAVTAVTLALADAAPRVRADIAPDAMRTPVARGLHQVFVNVLRNAADATGPTGRVEIRATRDRDELRIELRDDGPGMPPAVLQRVFEPFFTTKPPGKGTGLGLPISARVVEKMGGAITVECPPAGGTVVRITLPVGPVGSRPPVA